jgi:hypothetical protein
VGESSGECSVSVWRPGRKSHLKDPGVDGSMILKYILRSGMGMHG